MCAGRVSVVPALDAAVPAVGLDAADHHLDGQHYSHLLRLAFADAWSSVDRSGLDYGCWNMGASRWPLQLSGFAG